MAGQVNYPGMYIVRQLPGKFGRKVSAPPTMETSEDTGGDDLSSPTKLKQLKVAPLNYDNAILVIKFDDTNFDYSTALFESISNALEQIPSAAFEVVAVSPTSGPSYADNARDKASEVFSKIVEMGVPTERVSITSSTSTSRIQSAYRIHRSLRPYHGPKSLQSCQKLTTLMKIISTKCTITTESPTPRNQKMKPVMRPVTSTT